MTSPAWAPATASPPPPWCSSGFSGVPNILDGEHNLLLAFSQAPDPQHLVEGLGERYSVTSTAIKPYAVGYPIQSALDALFTITGAHNLTGGDVASVVAKLPTDGAGVVNNRAMPDVNIQHCIALALVDGAVSFTSAHSYERMGDAEVLAMKERVTLQPEASLVMPEAPRQAIIEVTTTDGRVLSHHTKYAPGTSQNPLDTARVCEKARDLIAPVIGDGRDGAAHRPCPPHRGRCKRARPPPPACAGVASTRSS